MQCHYPITAYYPQTPDESGKKKLIFDARDKNAGYEVELPCGKCIGCRLDKAREWAVRITHEAQMHDHNAFITLTYDDEHLPTDRGLHHSDFQEFMKRFRDHIFRNEKKKYDISCVVNMESLAVPAGKAAKFARATPLIRLSQLLDAHIITQSYSVMDSPMRTNGVGQPAVIHCIGRHCWRSVGCWAIQRLAR